MHDNLVEVSLEQQGKSERYDTTVEEVQHWWQEH